MPKILRKKVIKMELTMNGFKEMNEQEMMDVDGGLVFTIAGLYIGAKVGKAILVKVAGKSVSSKIAGGATGLAGGGSIGWDIDKAVGRRIARRLGW